ncbi:MULTISPECIES: hypothetical protein [unclassified Mesorhizobium]|uniref:hypothetical protein n=1 Tax=unclassified Mesorhizobium TaxID=325217 RepID=UPI00112E2E4F|nr:MULTISPECIES: hypothetical protein [unclassified Mesorhizobium]MBZ9701621.1 hypothetical protein [Mesorhizobium sp. CO1-1-3]MBZ9949231.1 hypothetical protein [Mesorhizobium sp. BR1-1-11]TPI99572.1 hypothetical protein FJ428_21805 [Mesorhizobium sp. B2-8-1]
MLAQIVGHDAQMLLNQQQRRQAATEYRSDADADYSADGYGIGIVGQDCRAHRNASQYEDYGDDAINQSENAYQ